VFLAIIQLLSPRQRAVLIMRDVLGLSASQTAARLDLTAAAVNSALQRARAILRDRLPPGHDWKPAPPTDAERALLTRFLDAYEWVGLAALAAENPNVRA
jgi:RNA polymerase sigma-70 factor (ECF subfamily)